MENIVFSGINPRDYKLDLASNTLTISKRFNDRIQDISSEEFALVAHLKNTIPNLQVIHKTHSTPSTYRAKQTGEKFNHNPNKGLTYEAMENFIKSLSNSAEYQEQYKVAKVYAEAQGKRAHSIVVKWFVEQFPHYRKNPYYYFRNRPNVIPFALKEETQSFPDAVNQ